MWHLFGAPIRPKRIFQVHPHPTRISLEQAAHQPLDPTILEQYCGRTFNRLQKTP